MLEKPKRVNIKSIFFSSSISQHTRAKESLCANYNKAQKGGGGCGGETNIDKLNSESSLHLGFVKRFVTTLFIILGGPDTKLSIPYVSLYE